MGRARSQTLAADSFEAVLGTRRGRRGSGNGEHLQPTARLAHVLSALEHGELEPGLVWMAESPYPLREHDYERARARAYAQTTATLLELVAESEVAHARWLTSAVGAPSLLGTHDIVAEIVRRSGSNNSVAIARHMQQGLEHDLPTLREIVRRYIRQLLCEYLARCVHKGGVSSVRQILGPSRQRELAADIRAQLGSGLPGDRRDHALFQCSALGQKSWQQALDYYDEHSQELRTRTHANARSQLRDILLGAGYEATNIKRRAHSP
jgi:hypothetical protein